MRRLLLPSVALAMLTLGACGTSGGNNGDDSATPPPASGVNLGSRAVPGYAVQASRLSEVAAGQPVTIRITVTPEAGELLPQSVELWAGAEFDELATPIIASAVPDLNGVYEAAIPMPDLLPEELTAWARLRMADGSVLELGRDDFLLLEPVTAVDPQAVVGPLEL